MSNQGLTRETNTCPYGPARTSVIAPNGQSDANWSGVEADFKAYVLEDAGYAAEGVELGVFNDVAYLNPLFPVSCTAASRIDALPVGETLESTIVLDKWRAPLGTGTFQSNVSAVFESSAGSVTASTDLAVSLAGVAELTLPDLVDAALGDARFTSWLHESSRESWVNPSVLYWPNAAGQFPDDPAYEGIAVRVAEIGLFRDEFGHEEFGAAIVNSSSGEVLAIRLN